MSKREDIADAKQAWGWIILGWGLFLFGVMINTYEALILAFSCGTAANMIGTYVGARRFWRKKK